MITDDLNKLSMNLQGWLQERHWYDYPTPWRQWPETSRSGTTHLKQKPVLVKYWSVLLSVLITGCGDLLHLGFSL